MTEPGAIMATRQGRLGHITLNRPKALHALDQGMCEALLQVLLEFRADAAIDAVLIDHAGERGFCAGGDVRMLADSVRAGAGDNDAAARFFYTEYQLDHLLFTYPKPIAVVMDGVVMGGGAGISWPCRYRIATERTRFAMPEAGIGLFPDVGSSWFLPRLPAQCGYWLALTGTRIEAADCLYLGLATHYVPSASLPALKQAMVRAPHALAFAQALSTACMPAPQPALTADLEAIRESFGRASLEAVLASLRAQATGWARQQLERLATKSPYSLHVTWRLLREGATSQSFADNLELEYRVAVRMVQLPDFSEGVRAMLIDRDGKPAWQPSEWSDVTPSMLDATFAALPADQAWKPLPA